MATEQLQALDLHSQDMLVRVIPYRRGEFTLLTFINMLESLDMVDDVLSLEISADSQEPRLYFRTRHADRVVSAMETHYPDVQLEYVDPEDDPLEIDDHESCWQQAMWPGGQEWLPFRVYDDSRLLEYGEDPFIKMLAGLGEELRPGERIISRLMLRQMSHSWSKEWRSRAIRGAGGENQNMAETTRSERDADRVSQQPQRTETSEMDPLYLVSAVVLFIIAGAIASKWLLPLWRKGATAELMIYGGILLSLVVVLLVGGYWVARKLGFFAPKSPPIPHDPDQVAIRISGSAYRMEVQLYAVMPQEALESTEVRRLFDHAVAAYRSFDNPIGNQFMTSSPQPADHPANKLIYLADKQKKNFFGRSSNYVGEGVIGAREVAAFWHIPSRGVCPQFKRAASRRFALPSVLNERTAGSFLIGTEHYRDGGILDVYLPEEAHGSHQLYFARTRMGKSTLMGHVVGGYLRWKASGQCKDAIVVVDPHSDLVSDIMACVPPGIVSDVRLIDLGDPDRSCGINLLDVQVFRDRDATIAGTINVVRSILPEQWGGRMELIMRYALLALYEANRLRRPEEQYTLLDIRLMLAHDDFRRRVLKEVQAHEEADQDVLDWWTNDFEKWTQQVRSEAITPVQNRLAYYSGSKVARRILGQRQCTLNLYDVISAGQILLVDTARGDVGEAVAAMVGAAILNLTSSIVSQQARYSPDKRRRVVLIVDEMQTIPGVPFDKMLAEHGKFGGSVIMATQSLAKLNEVALHMSDTVLANLGCLVVFQSNSTDAEALVRELDSDHLDALDITSLPRHHCYGRANLAGGSTYFSMQVLPPYQARQDIADWIRLGSHAYTRPTAEVDEERNRWIALESDGARPADAVATMTQSITRRGTRGGSRGRANS